MVQSAMLMIMPAQNPALGNGLMYFVFALMAVQGMIASACMVAGFWGPVSRLLGATTRR